MGGKGEKAKVPVPALAGETLAKAKQMGENGNFKVVEDGSKFCEDQKKDTVCTQTPAAGAEVERDGTVKVVMSKGIEKVSVPPVTGLSLDDATSTLKDKGFKVEQKQEESEKTPNSVIGQDPSSGSKAEKGATVTLTIAQAPQTKTVPPVVGKSWDDASKQLTDVGFTPQKQEQESTQPAGTVLKQTPDGNTQAQPNSTVTLTVAKAAEKFSMPSLVGKKLKDAKKELGDAQLTLGSVAGPQDDDATVIMSDPLPNTQVSKGQTVSLTTAGGSGGGDSNGDGNDSPLWHDIIGKGKHHH